jgi:hypothetical protein
MILMQFGLFGNTPHKNSKVGSPSIDGGDAVSFSNTGYYFHLCM